MRRGRRTRVGASSSDDELDELSFAFEAALEEVVREEVFRDAAGRDDESIRDLLGLPERLAFRLVLVLEEVGSSLVTLLAIEAGALFLGRPRRGLSSAAGKRAGADAGGGRGGTASFGTAPDEARSEILRTLSDLRGGPAEEEEEEEDIPSSSSSLSEPEVPSNPFTGANFPFALRVTCRPRDVDEDATLCRFFGEVV